MQEYKQISEVLSEVFKELFKPGKIGNLTLKNRIFMTPMGNGSMQNPDGGFSERVKDYFENIAKGGVGMILTGSTLMTKVTNSYGRKSLSTVFYDKTYVNGASEMCDALHRWGCKACIQLTPGDGRLWTFLGEAPISSSDGLPSVLGENILSKGATTQEVKQIINDYRNVAFLVKVAGFDAIQIRAYGGYFTDQFMTAAWNNREDEYGGDLDGRLRILMEMIEAVKEGAGADFPLIVKMSPVHYFEGGREIEEGIEICKRLEAAGVDAIHLEKGSYENWWDVIPPAQIPLANQLDVSKVIKKEVAIPIMAHGKLGIIPDLAEQALREGKTDFVGLGRSLLADPEWPRKVKEGRLQDVRPCIGCQMGCLNRIFQDKYVSCAVNPQTGNEKERTLTPAVKKKRVLVVGGGPAGMEAALIASSRGHEVTLCEKNSELGGALLTAGAVPFKKQLEMLRCYYIVQLAKAGVKVECGRKMDPDTIRERKPEVVFVATGSKPRRPQEIEGINRPHVHMVEEILLGQEKAISVSPGTHIAILGGGEVGCEMAVYMAKKYPHIDITIVEMLEELCSDSFVNIKWYLERRIGELKIKTKLKSRVVEIKEKNVTLADGSSIAADSVMVALGYEANTEIAESLKADGAEVFVLGDCIKPRKVINAVWEAFEAARSI